MTTPPASAPTSHRCAQGRNCGRAQQPGEQCASLERLDHAAEAARGRVERDEVQRQAVCGGTREHDRAWLAGGAQRGSEGGRVLLELRGGEKLRRLQQAGRHPDLTHGTLAALQVHDVVQPILAAAEAAALLAALGVLPLEEAHACSRGRVGWGGDWTLLDTRTPISYNTLVCVCK